MGVAANWAGDVAPAFNSTSDLFFTSSAVRPDMAIGAARTASSLTYTSGVTSDMSISYNALNSTGVVFTLQAASGNAAITVASGATGNITLGLVTGTGLGNGTGSLTLNSTVDISHNGSGNLTFNRQINGTGGINKTGNGTMVISSLTDVTPNTYSGLTTVSGGNVLLAKFAGNNAFGGNVLVNGTGTVTYVNSGQISNNATVEVATGGTLALSALNDTIGGLTLTGGAITGSGTLTSSGSYDLQSGSSTANFAGSGNITKSTSGTVDLSGTSSVTGAVLVNAGILNLTGTTSAMTGAVTVNGGTLRLGSAATLAFASNINLNGGAFQIVTDGLGKTYSTTPIVVGGASASTLIYENTSASTSANLTFSGAGSFALNNNLTIQNISSNATLNNLINVGRPLTGSGNLIVETNNNLTAIGNSFTFGRVQLQSDNSAWTGNLTIAKGTAQLSGVNSAGNGTTITIGTTGDSFGAGLAFNQGANYTLSQNITVATGGFRGIKNNGSGALNVALNGNITLNGDLAVDHSLDLDRTFTLAGVISGSGGLTISGISGSYAIVSGNNTYTGNTTVSSGTLILDGTVVSPTVSVSTGSRFGGNGTVSGNLIMAAGSQFVFSLTSVLDVSGTVSLDNAFSVASLVNANGTAVDWTLVNIGTYTLIGSTMSTFNNIMNFGQTNAADLGGGKSAYFENGSLNLVVIPEPSPVLLLLSSLGIMALLRRRCRQCRATN